MEFEFIRNQTLDNLDKAPEAFRGMYRQTADGVFELPDNMKSVGAALDGLNKSLRAARRDAEEARKSGQSVAAFGQVGQMLGLQGEEATSADALKSALEKVLSEAKDGQVNWQKNEKGP